MYDSMSLRLRVVALRLEAPENTSYKLALWQPLDNTE